MCSKTGSSTCSKTLERTLLRTLTSPSPLLKKPPPPVAMAESRRDWAQLPPELIEKIAGHLGEIPDLFRFLSVCVSWRSASKSISTDDLPPQLPCLLIPYDGSRPPTNNGGSRLFSLSENRIYTISFPESQDQTIFASPRGWVIAATEPVNGVRHLSLLNPITRSSTPLPPLSSPGVLARSLKLGRIKLFGSDLVALRYKTRILYCRAGETSWKKIYTSQLYPFGDLAYQDGRFFVYDDYSEAIWVIDINGRQRVTKFLPGVATHVRDNFLVESPSKKELLWVLRHRLERRKEFRVFRLDESEQQMKWVEVDSIGDGVLFVDGYQAMCFDARDFKGRCRGNCIYFVGYCDNCDRDGRKERCGVKLFDIGEGLVEPVPLFSGFSCLDSELAKWIVPSLC